MATQPPAEGPRGREHGNTPELDLKSPEALAAARALVKEALEAATGCNSDLDVKLDETQDAGLDVRFLKGSDLVEVHVYLCTKGDKHLNLEGDGAFGALRFNLQAACGATGYSFVAGSDHHHFNFSRAALEEKMVQLAAQAGEHSAVDATLDETRKGLGCPQKAFDNWRAPTDEWELMVGDDGLDDGTGSGE